MIRLKDVMRPLTESEAQHLRALAGVMMQHHARAPWWNVRLKLATYVGARSYAKRSMDRV